MTIQITTQLRADLEKLRSMSGEQLNNTGSLPRAALEYLCQPFRVYRMNDCHYWMAQSLTEAKEDYMAFFGIDSEDVDDARELTDGELEEADFFTDRPGGDTSFAHELELRIQEDPKSQIFADANY